MAYGLMEQVLHTLTPAANTAAVIHRRFVKVDASTGISYSEAAENSIGVSHRIDNTADAEYEASYRNRVPIVNGIIEVEAAEPIAIGGLVGSDANGKAVAIGDAEIVKGVAMTACTGAGSVLVLTIGFNVHATPAGT